MKRVLAIIPARLQSSRLPRKLLLKETGKFLIQHVHEQVLKAKLLDRVVIATDNEEIFHAVTSFGAEAIMTRDDHVSGTDRVAEAVRLLSEGAGPKLVLNVQGDEPEIDPAQLDQLVEVMAGCDDPMGTLAETIIEPEDHGRSQVVKVVLNHDGQALYFSRAPIPSGADPRGVPALRHLGIYAYRPEFLQAFCTLPPAPLERAERLEQLRALFHGHAIRVAVVEGSGARGIDTREDYDGFLARLAGR